MDEYLRLHKLLSEAFVEYQQKFDALKRFDDGLIMRDMITDIETTLAERDKLEAEERAAYEKRKAAEKTYKAFLKRIKHQL